MSTEEPEKKKTDQTTTTPEVKAEPAMVPAEVAEAERQRADKAEREKSEVDKQLLDQKVETLEQKNRGDTEKIRGDKAEAAAASSKKTSTVLGLITLSGFAAWVGPTVGKSLRKWFK